MCAEVLSFVSKEHFISRLRTLKADRNRSRKHLDNLYILLSVQFSDQAAYGPEMFAGML